MVKRVNFVENFAVACNDLGWPAQYQTGLCNEFPAAGQSQYRQQTPCHTMTLGSLKFLKNLQKRLAGSESAWAPWAVRKVTGKEAIAAKEVFFELSSRSKTSPPVSPLALLKKWANNIKEERPGPLSYRPGLSVANFPV